MSAVAYSDNVTPAAASHAIVLTVTGTDGQVDSPAANTAAMIIAITSHLKASPVCNPSQ
jgi:hypothetical protein